MSKELENFLKIWRSEHPTLTVFTSGSTGVPKAMEVEKQRMRASARMTAQLLGLTAHDTALLCMPLRYIAGMMMVVRAEEVGMQLVEVVPSNHPLKDLKEAPSFAAMVSSQVFETLRVPEERERFCQIRHVIIGGGAIDNDLEAELQSLPNHIWHSYGMTETLSHIALRNIKDKWFYPLPGISLSKDENDCLIINAPLLNPSTLHTHDIVEMNEEGGFKVKGRIDNVICSGGIKIQIEEVEATLRPTFGNTIQVTSAPHPKFGEVVVYLTTQPIDEHFLHLCIPNPYWLPKRIIQVPELPKTGTGKPDRAKAKEIVRPK